jgi:putative ABC transport system substrate-binding protein
MRRREFLTLLGGGAVAWPLAAHAQQQPVIGFLSVRSADDSASVLEAFRKGLGEGGYAERRNVRIEFRWAEGQVARLPALAAELAERRVTVIAAVGGEPAVLAARRVTSTIPIVYVGGADPLQAGIVTSLGRPEGNVTGVTLYSNALEPKKLQLLRELVPAASTVAALVNRQSPIAAVVRGDVEAAAKSLGQKIEFFDATTEREIEEAFSKIAQSKIGALVVSSNPFFSTAREKIIALAAHYAVPAIFDSRIQVAAGGLMSYGASYTDTYRQAGIYTSRVLSGAKPADLPVLLPAKFELAINMKTAKALGLNVPLHLQQLADEVIE